MPPENEETNLPRDTEPAIESLVEQNPDEQTPKSRHDLMVRATDPAFLFGEMQNITRELDLEALHLHARQEEERRKQAKIVKSKKEPPEIKTRTAQIDASGQKIAHEEKTYITEIENITAGELEQSVKDSEVRSEEPKSTPKKEEVFDPYAGPKPLSDFTTWLAALPQTLQPEPPPMTDKKSKSQGKKHSKALNPKQKKKAKGKHKKNKVKSKSLRRKDKKPKSKPSHKTSVVLEGDIISETLADLLAEQGHRKEARKMYKKLGLIYPEKSSFFARKLKRLKK